MSTNAQFDLLMLALKPDFWDTMYNVFIFSYIEVIFKKQLRLTVGYCFFMVHKSNGAAQYHSA